MTRLAAGMAVLMIGCAEDLTVEWPYYGGDAGAMKYSTVTALNTDNISQLELAWEWETGERAIPETDSTLAARPGTFQVIPLMVGDTLFFSTPYNRVIALDAATGQQFWEHDPGAYVYGQPSNGTGFVHRGVATWADNDQRIIFMTSRWRLLALDGATGDLIRTFGDTGVVDLAGDLIWNVERRHYTNTSPPVVIDDLVIVGNGVGDRLTYRNDPPGDIQAYNVHTGERVWRFSPIPQPGEFGNETWEDSSWAFVGHTNVWAPFTADLERGLIYLPLSTPSNDFYGGHRKGDNLFAESVLCLDARTGERVWHFQTIRHGLWDYDLPAPPVLATITIGDEPIDVVMQVSKQGFVYVFNRVTGEPVWPIVDRPVPASTVPGERAAETQPFPTLPAPFARQGFSEADLIDFVPGVRELAREVLEQFDYGSLYTPPSQRGTVLMPGLIGGAGWGGGAFDPETQTLYVKATNWPYRIAVAPPTPSDTIQGDYALARPLTLEISAERLAEFFAIETDQSLPIHKPPYGTLTAIDMGTGQHRWQSVVGDMPHIRNHVTFGGLDFPKTGVTGAPGPLVSAGGLVLLSGGGDVLYAFDKTTGAELWSHELGMQAYSNPMMYATRDGTPYVIVPTGRDSAVLKAFSLQGVQ